MLAKAGHDRTLASSCHACAVGGECLENFQPGAAIARVTFFRGTFLLNMAPSTMPPLGFDGKETHIKQTLLKFAALSRL